MRAMFLALGGLIVAGASGCFLFSDGVNELPVVRITGPAALYLYQEGVFAAEVSNKAAAGMKYRWGVVSVASKGECDRLGFAQAETAVTTPMAGDGLTGSRSEPTAKVVANPAQDPLAPAAPCLVVVVTDQLGARQMATRMIQIRLRKLVIQGPAQVTSSVPVTYTAEFEDEPAATPRALLGWGVGSACPAAQDEARTRRPNHPGWVSFQYTASRSAFCLAVVGEDEFGAPVGAQQMIANVINGGPPATIQMVEPVASMAPPPLGIFSPVRLAAAGPGELAPSDVIGFAWRVTRPDGSSFEPAGCDLVRPEKSEVCFDVGDAGRYTVDLTSSEGSETRKATPMVLTVEDQSPCILQTEPSFTSSPTVIASYDREQVFRVLQVRDDGDPLPPLATREPQYRFQWAVSTGGAAFQKAPGAIYRDYVIPARQHQPGDEVRVQVEYRDRHDLSIERAPRVSCDDDDVTCPRRPNEACTHRVTWKVVYL